MGDVEAWTKEQLLEAVEHRTQIGEALGILMERFDMTEEQAVAYLKRCSQEANTKLYGLAVELVETRELPTVENPQTA